MVVGKLLRLAGHGEHDDARYIPAEKRNQPHGGDCVALARERILRQGWMGGKQLEAVEAEIQGQVDEAVARAQSEPDPNPFRETWQALSTRHLAEGHSQAG